MKFLFEDFRKQKNKHVLQAIQCLINAGIPIEKITENFGDMQTEDAKIIAVARASNLIAKKIVSFMRLGILYECSPVTFDSCCQELEELHRSSPDKYHEITKNNWDFLTHFISSHKSPKAFWLLYEKEPKKFKKLRANFL